MEEIVARLPEDKRKLLVVVGHHLGLEHLEHQSIEPFLDSYRKITRNVKKDDRRKSNQINGEHSVIIARKYLLA